MQSIVGEWESAHIKLEARIILRYVHCLSHINIYIYTEKSAVDMTRWAHSARQLFPETAGMSFRFPRNPLNIVKTFPLKCCRM